MPTSNKARAIDFLKLAASGKVDDVYTLYVSPQFKHHNSHFKGDAQFLKQGMKDSFAQFSNKLLEVKRALEDGEHVAIHLRVRLTPDGRDIALIHLFRFEENRIAELWVAAEMAPATPVNENGLF
jgi:predicted SnoaL-like aldol condensation-catalyzing enzyme